MAPESLAQHNVETPKDDQYGLLYCRDLLLEMGGFLEHFAAICKIGRFGSSTVYMGENYVLEVVVQGNGEKPSRA